MIITITFNPAIDKTIYEDKTVFDIGGKGINVAKTLRSLNCDCLAIGFCGKSNSKLLYDELDSLNIRHHFFEIEGSIRTNTKYIKNNKLIEENEEGPYISDNDINSFIEYVSDFNNEIIVIAGSVNRNVDRNIYKRLIELFKKNNNYVILDCDSDLLRNGIDGKPDVIKPNRKEVCELFSIKDDIDLIIQNIKRLDLDLSIVSLDKQGALFVYKDAIYYCKALDVDYKSSLGAGDSLIGAISYSKLNNLSIIDTIKLAMACSFASVEKEGSKPADYERIQYYLDKVIIEKI